MADEWHVPPAETEDDAMKFSTRGLKAILLISVWRVVPIRSVETFRTKRVWIRITANVVCHSPVHVTQEDTDEQSCRLRKKTVLSSTICLR